jgi:hypothetical protein
MKTSELLLAELEREAARSSRALEQVPEGHYDWKPHDRSMHFGYLAELVATMPSWVAMAITRDELDLRPPGGGTSERPSLRTSQALLEAHEKAVADARAALSGATDEALLETWKLLVGGQVVMETPRQVVIGDTLNHIAHHRGQMTVYLRLLGAKVPALYGPSADDRSF